MVGEKKFFFGSFLSRDDGSRHGLQSKSNTNIQDMTLESTSGTNEICISGEAENSEILREDLESSERDEDISMSEEFKTPIEGEAKSVPAPPLEVQENLEEYVETVTDIESLSSQRDPKWVQDNSEAPNVPQNCVKVAEAIFPLKVEEFFILYFSEDATDFVNSYHERCKDRDLKVSSWYTQNEFGHARDVYFQHPINIYFGAKFCSCQEVQKYRVYRDSHLVIETSQVVRDVPYGDYFSVKGLWDVERDENDSNSCTLRFYVGVDFSKKTMWRGKIEKSTLDEARETYSTWKKIADELLKQKNVEKEAFMRNADKTQQERLTSLRSVEHENVNQPADDPLNTSRARASFVSSLAEALVKSYSSIKSQSQIPVLLIVVFALILLLTQLSIVVLLSRSQQVRMIPQAAEYMRSSSFDSSGRMQEMSSWLDKKVQQVKEEMLVIETMVEKMRGEHSLLKAQLRDLEKIQLSRHHKS